MRLRVRQEFTSKCHFPPISGETEMSYFTAAIVTRATIHLAGLVSFIHEQKWKEGQNDTEMYRKQN